MGKNYSFRRLLLQRDSDAAHKFSCSELNMTLWFRNTVSESDPQHYSSNYPTVYIILVNLVN